MVDLRLAIPAMGAWIVVGIAISVPELLVIVSAAAWSLCVIALIVAARRGHPGGPAVLAALVAAAIALVVTSAAVRLPAREPSALVSIADSGQRTSLVATTTETVHASMSSFAVRITEASAMSSSHVIDIPARVFADSAGLDLAIGTVITASGSLVRTDPGDTTAFLVFVDGPVEIAHAPPWILTATDSLRAGLRDLCGALPGDGGGLLPGLAIGDTSAVSDSLDTAMKATSLSHLTAVSGANCAVVVGLVMLLAGRLRLARPWRITSAMVVLAGFVLLVTPEPSVLRAAVMALIVLVSLMRGRPSRGVPVLSLAVIVVLVTDPWLAREYGFVLSVLATGGLLLLAGPLTRSLARVMPAPLAAIIAIPLSAQLACQPVIVLLSPTLPTFGVLANILAGPVAPLGTVLGLLACVVAPIAPPIAVVVVHLAWLPASWIAGVARVLSSLPGAQLPWLGDAVGVGVTAVSTLAVVVMLLVSPRSSRLLWRLSASVVAAVVVGYLGVAGGGALRIALTRPAEWIYGACEVGQGDASLVRSSGQVAVIDVGPDPALMTSCLDQVGFARVDLLVLTHFDLDHVGGVGALVGKVDDVLVGPVDRPEAQRIVDSLRSGGARVREVSRGATGELGDLSWTVLWPTDPLRGIEPGNDASVTLLFGGRSGCGAECASGLFLGDLGESAQIRMIAPTSVGEVDVVKVAHHGSADQSASLYERVDASVALIGVGAANDYGHPTQSLLNLLRRSGTVVTRTDQNGLVLIAPSEDGALEVWRERGG